MLRFNAAGVRAMVRRPPPSTVMRRAIGGHTSKAANLIRGWTIEPVHPAALLWPERIALVHLNSSIVGNIKPWKGREVVIRAIEMLRDRLPDLVCLLIGDTSPDDSAYRVQILR
ncbi:MAG: hypothetical protein AB7T20_03425 [Steroidobacteraceae bacterium]